MGPFARIALPVLALIASPALAQDEDGGGSADSEIIVTATAIRDGVGSVPEKPPVVGLRRQADSALRRIEIVSDSRTEDMRKSEVQAMLLAAIDRARTHGLSLVTGNYEVIEVTRESWRNQFPALAAKPNSSAQEDDEDEDDEDDEDAKPKPAFEDDGSTATIRLMVKTKLAGSIADAQGKIGAFVKGVPATGRSQIAQKGEIALTIVNPDQYRDEVYKRVATAARHAATFYGADYGAQVTGLDRALAWKQVSNTEVFLYVPYSFVVTK